MTMTFTQAAYRYTGLCSPIAQSQGLPAEADFTTIALVLALLQWSTPFAVGRAITAVIVNSFDRCAERSRAHIGDKLRKGFAPFMTYLNSTAPVVLIRECFRILATINHRAIRTIESCSALAVSSHLISRAQRYVTSAGRRVAASQAGPLDRTPSAAIADAFPKRVTATHRAAGATQHNPFPKTPTGYVFAICVIHTGILAKTFGRGWTRRIVKTAIEAFA